MSERRSLKRHLSLKFRITLWFTLFLVIVTAVFLAAAVSLYMSYYSKSIRDYLIKTVDDEAHLLTNDRKLRESVLNNDISEAEFFKDDVRLMIYDEDGKHIAGLFFDNDIDKKERIKSDRPKEIEINGVSYYYYDKMIGIRHGRDYYVRGVVRAEESVGNIIGDNMALTLLVPLLIASAFAGGYFLTGILLRPIKTIDETTEEIRRSGDLTKRIEYLDNGDELSDLSSHINEMFDTLQNNFEAEKQFTSSASHELRTPVSVILAQCEYAIENADTKEEMAEVIASIQRQGYKMSHLIEALLLFTRIEQGTEKYPVEPVNISEIVSYSCEDFGLIADKNIKVVQKIQPEVRWQVNKELFSLMVNNLIQNAIRYGKENGHVYVELEQTEKELILRVSDDGIGIEREDITHVFDVFYRADKSRNSKGMGLGLSLVRKIAEYHNGVITVSSKPDKGSIFEVILK
ncbi:MAG: HAMP domain-containing histidine kinase [Lachnospiraceae bacterium]|nr:HAMP domain-containing histidine kinase [Lachnospiraceae bacterium]